MTRNSSHIDEYIVSWHDIHQKLRVLSKELYEIKRWKGIIAVTRGGLIPAGIVARELNIRIIDTLCVYSYKGQQQGDLKALKMPNIADREDYLLLDDLVDTGATASFVRQSVKQCFFATVFAKTEGKPYVDLFVEEVPQSTWIRFPWDTTLRFCEPLIGN